MVSLLIVLFLLFSHAAGPSSGRDHPPAAIGEHNYSRPLVPRMIIAVEPAAEITGITGTDLGDTLAWWFAPATQKIFRQCEPLPDRAGLLRAARGEFESIQLVIRGNVSLESLPVSYVPAGENPIPEEWVELFQVLYVATPGVAAWGFPESNPERREPEYPDPLVPLSATVTLPGGENQPLWIRIRVPENALPGEYSGYIAVGGIEAPLTLNVWSFEISRAGSLRTAFGLGGKDLAGQYGVEPWSEEYRELYRRYYEALLDYRISAFYVPFGGGAAGGKIMDPDAEPYLMDQRMTSFITLYSSEDEEMLASWNYLLELGICSKAWLYNLDEPRTQEEYRAIKNQASYLKEIVPELKYGVTFYAGPKWDRERTPFDELGKFIDLWILQTNYYFHGNSLGNKIKEQARLSFDRGDDIWLYVALAPREPFCNFLVNNSALQHRLLFWQIYGEEIVSGLLYWQTTHWSETENPYTDIATVKRIDPHLWGDGSLFYPGTPYGLDGPVGSIRLELIRDGLEDFEYLLLAKELLGRDETMELVEQVAPSLDRCLDDPVQFEQIRRWLGETIDALTNP